jgi:hypothetical protein
MIRATVLDQADDNLAGHGNLKRYTQSYQGQKPLNYILQQLAAVFFLCFCRKMKNWPPRFFLG